jgi:hypothetical protein
MFSFFFRASWFGAEYFGLNEEYVVGLYTLRDRFGLDFAGITSLPG